MQHPAVEHARRIKERYAHHGNGERHGSGGAKRPRWRVTHASTGEIGVFVNHREVADHLGISIAEWHSYLYSNVDYGFRIHKVETSTSDEDVRDAARRRKAEERMRKAAEDAAASRRRLVVDAAFGSRMAAHRVSAYMDRESTARPVRIQESVEGEEAGRDARPIGERESGLVLHRRTRTRRRPGFKL